MSFTSSLRQILFGSPFGDVYPPRPNPTSLAVDGRTVALRILREYVCNLTFFLPMQKGAKPKPFKIEQNNFHIEWPDYETDLVFPSAIVVPSRARYDAIGLVSYVEETTRDVYKKGTVLQWQGEYVENIQLEVHASSRPERRSIIAGIETALTPTEQMYGLRFKMPDYFNELVCFTLNDRENIDDRMSALKRRRVQLGIEMRFNIVALVNYTQLIPQVVTNTDVAQPDQTVVDLQSDPNARVIIP